MRKIAFAVTKCTNDKCGFRIISEVPKSECPICKHKMVKDKNYFAQGYDNKETNDAFIGFKKKAYKGKRHDRNRPKNIKTKK